MTVVKSAANMPSTVVKIAAASAISVATHPTSIDDVIKDAKDFRFFNTDESKVLKSTVFSSYKGTPGIRHSLPGSSFSISNTIFLNSTEGDDLQGKLTVNHEWGHNVQDTILGTPKYIFKIVVPSVIGYNKIKNNDKVYYSQPWERSADFLGGANRGESNYIPGSDKQSDIYLIFP